MNTLGKSLQTSDASPLADDPVFIGSREEGPFPRSTIARQVAAGILQPRDLGWTPGLPDWVPIQQFIPAPVNASEKRWRLVLFRFWRKALLAIQRAALPLRWLTPAYWLARRNRPQELLVAANLLPAAYDPVGEEMVKRARVAPQAEDLPGASMEENEGIPSIVANLDRAVEERRRTLLGTSEMAAYTAYDVVSGFAAIDKDLYTAIQQLRSTEIDTLSDLSKALANYDHGVMSGLSAGALVKVHGHVGESVVANHLEAAGMKVDWASTSNNKGWDLLVDGHQLDVKAAARDVWSSSISSHFKDHPHIPVVVSGDALHIPSDAVHFNSELGTGFESLSRALEHGGSHQVFVDDALSHTALHDQVEHATSAAIGSPDTVHHHLPFVTLALSGNEDVKAEARKLGLSV